MTIEIGELRDQLSYDLQDRVLEIINKKQDDPSYYLMVVSKLDPLNKNQVNSKIFTMYKNRLPTVPLLGTICVYVNNKQGCIESQWCLPLDIHTHDITDLTEINMESFKDGQQIKQAILNN